jgi:hypothetical protein
MKNLFICVVLIMIIASAASLPFVLNAGFGQPQGEQLGSGGLSAVSRRKFHNTLPTPGYNGDKNMLVAMWEFLTKKPKTPPGPAAAAGENRSCEPAAGAGHPGVASSWYLQLAGKRILIDPVLGNYAAPFSFLNKAFAGSIRGALKACRRSTC